MKGVILDTDTLAYGEFDDSDLDMAALMSQLDSWQCYGTTAAAQLAERIAGAEVVLSNKVVIDAQTMDCAPALKLIAIMATGTNIVDLQAARERGIVVCNAQDYSTASVAQHTLALILALAAGLTNYDAAVRRGAWTASETFCLLDYPIAELAGKTLGIVGYGNLGRKVAAIAEAFDMKVCVAQSLTANAVDGRQPLNELLPTVDVLTLHCPLSEQSRNLIDAEKLALMKPTALLINTARGGIVDEWALAEALRAGQLAGAASDVLSVEPPTVSNPLLQGDIPNLIITPHTAWASRESRQRLIDQLTVVIAAFKAGEPIQQVN